eukprot:747627-Hanusia_phi.AAC.6
MTRTGPGSSRRARRNSRTKTKQAKGEDKISLPSETKTDANGEADPSAKAHLDGANTLGNGSSQHKAQAFAGTGASQGDEDGSGLAASSKPGTVLHWLSERKKRMKVVAAATAELEKAIVGLTCDPRLSESQTERHLHLNSLMRTAHDLVLRVEGCDVSPATTVDEEDEFPFVADVLSDLRKFNSSWSKRSKGIEPVPKGVNGSDDHIDSIVNGENPPNSGPEGPSPNYSTKIEDTQDDLLPFARQKSASSDLPRKSVEFPPIFFDSVKDVSVFSQSKGSDQLSASEIRLLTQTRTEEPLNTMPRSDQRQKLKSSSDYQSSYQDFDTVNQLTWENTSLQRRVEVQASALIELSVEKEKWMSEKYRLIDEQDKARKRIKLLLEEKEELKSSLQRVIEGLVTENQFLSQVASVRHDPRLGGVATENNENHSVQEGEPELEPRLPSQSSLLGPQLELKQSLVVEDSEKRCPDVGDGSVVRTADSASSSQVEESQIHSVLPRGDEVDLHQALATTAVEDKTVLLPVESEGVVTHVQENHAPGPVTHNAHRQVVQEFQTRDDVLQGDAAKRGGVEGNASIPIGVDAAAENHSAPSLDTGTKAPQGHQEDHRHAAAYEASHEYHTENVLTKDKSSVRKAPPPRPFPPELLAHPGDKDIQIGLKHLLNPPQAAPPPTIYYVFDALWSVVSLRPVRTALFHSHKAEMDEDW